MEKDDMTININDDIFLCDFCGVVIRKKQCPQIILPEAENIYKFDNWECLSAWVMKKIMDDYHEKKITS